MQKFKLFLMIIFSTHVYADCVEQKLFYIEKENKRLKQKIYELQKSKKIKKQDYLLVQNEVSSSPVTAINEIKYKADTEENTETEGTGWYLALLDHAYYNINSGTMNDTFRAMLTYIMGNDWYFTFTPSFSFDIIYMANKGMNPRVNDAVVTFSYGSPGGGNPANVFATSGNFNAALSFTLPFSSYSRNVGMVTASSLSVGYVSLFNQRRTSVTIAPNFGYFFRRTKTSDPVITDAEQITETNSFSYMGNVFEKFTPYSELSLGLDLNVVHTIMQMTYLIGWVSLDSTKYYDDIMLYEGETIVVTPSKWTSSLSVGGKIFFPMFGYLWGDLSVMTSIPFEGDRSYTAAAGLSYFF